MTRPRSARPGGAPRVRSHRTPRSNSVELHPFSSPDITIKRDNALLSPVRKLAVICCYWNPMRCSHVRNNMHEFMDTINAPVFPIELTFTGEVDISEQRHPVIVGLHGQQLWQKERLLNIAERFVPESFDAIAWIDMDVLFENPDWQEETLQVLSHSRVCQLWSHSFERRDTELTPLRPSVCQGYVSGDPQCFHLGLYHPGFAWAMRRDTFHRIGGLLESNVVGNGDTHMCRGFFDSELWTDRYMSPAWKADTDTWKTIAAREISGRIGCASGNIIHLWHGDRKDRKYVERLSYLGDHDYDPVVDIEYGRNGLLTWTPYAMQNKPDMIAKVQGYFDERRVSVFI